MSALDYFEGIARDRERLEKVKQDIAFLESRISAHSQGFGATSHGSGDHDKVLRQALLSARIGELKAELPRLERKLERKLEHASRILYGTSGRGGLAKAKCTDDADILCCHYLQGMGWAKIAEQVVKPDTEWPTQWCMQRAKRAMNYIDRVGVDALLDS